MYSVLPGTPPDSVTFPVVVNNCFVLDGRASVLRRVTDDQKKIYINDDQKQCLFRVHEFRQRRQYLHDARNQPFLCVEKESVGWRTRLKDMVAGQESVGCRAAVRGAYRWQAYSVLWKENQYIKQNQVFFHCKRVKSELFHVFLPTNTSNETVPDFIVRGKNGHKFTVHYNDHLIAETNWKLSFKGRKAFTKAFPGVDQAFIGAILLLMEGGIKTERGNKGRGEGVGEPGEADGGGGGGGGGCQGGGGGCGGCV